MNSLSDYERLLVSRFIKGGRDVERYDITIQMYSADASGTQYVWERCLLKKEILCSTPTPRRPLRRLNSE